MTYYSESHDGTYGIGVLKFSNQVPHTLVIYSHRLLPCSQSANFDCTRDNLMLQFIDNP